METMETVEGELEVEVRQPRIIDTLKYLIVCLTGGESEKTGRICLALVNASEGLTKPVLSTRCSAITAFRARNMDDCLRLFMENVVKTDFCFNYLGDESLGYKIVFSPKCFSGNLEEIDTTIK
jgi:hypothetical protein